jgi:hypothetical protein
MGKTYIVLGTATIAGGVIAGLVYFIRHETVRSTINRNYGPVSTLSISPSVITTGITHTSALAFTVSVNF